MLAFTCVQPPAELAVGNFPVAYYFYYASDSENLNQWVKQFGADNAFANIEITGNTPDDFNVHATLKDGTVLASGHFVSGGVPVPGLPCAPTPDAGRGVFPKNANKVAVIDQLGTNRPCLSTATMTYGANSPILDLVGDTPPSTRAVTGVLEDAQLTFSRVKVKK